MRTLGTRSRQQGTASFQSLEHLTVMDVGAEANIYVYLVVLQLEKTVWEGVRPYKIVTEVVTNGEKPAMAI